MAKQDGDNYIMATRFSAEERRQNVLTSFPPLSKFPGMFFHASCYNCKHADFVHFSKLMREGYGDGPYNQVMQALKCSKCGGKHLAVTLHGAGVSGA